MYSIWRHLFAFKLSLVFLLYLSMSIGRTSKLGDIQVISKLQTFSTLYIYIYIYIYISISYYILLGCTDNTTYSSHTKSSSYTNPIINSNHPDPGVLALPDGSGYVVVTTSNYATKGIGINGFKVFKLLYNIQIIMVMYFRIIKIQIDTFFKQIRHSPFFSPLT